MSTALDYNRHAGPPAYNPPTEEDMQADFLRALEEEAAVNLSDRVGKDVYLDHLLERLRERREKIKENNAFCDRRVAMIEAHRSQINGSLARECRWLDLGVQAAAESYDYGSKKSRSLPNGSFGYRWHGEKVVVQDDAAAVRFAEANGLPVKKTPLLTPLKEHMKATGEVPDGCQVVPGEDRFFVEAG